MIYCRSRLVTTLKFFRSPYEFLNSYLVSLAQRKECEVSELSENLHVWPDFHGNRSPLADPSLRGMVSGLSLSDSIEDLALLYLATLQALVVSDRPSSAVIMAYARQCSVVKKCINMTGILKQYCCHTNHYYYLPPWTALKCLNYWFYTVEMELCKSSQVGQNQCGWVGDVWFIVVSNFVQKRSLHILYIFSFIAAVSYEQIPIKPVLVF